jgi:hypothetical protein
MSDPKTVPPRRVRNAELLIPPNVLKEKAGSGGLDERTLVKAQDSLANNTVDFAPIADTLLGILNEAILNAKSGTAQGEAAIEAMMHPVMQIKAQGGMFDYALVTELGNLLLNFLETVTKIDDDVLAIVIAHKQAIGAIVAGKIKGDGSQIGKDLRNALSDACNRFYRTRAE